MIDFNPIDQAYTEGFISSVLSDVGVDAHDMSDAWDNANGAIEKMDVANRHGLKRARDSLRDTSRVLKKHSVDTRSIVARAKNSILQFPVYITQTNPVDAAHTISKLFERVYASLVQSVLSANQIIDEDEANNLEFLKRFHTNIKEQAERFGEFYGSVYNEWFEPIDDLDLLIQESVQYTQQITENCSVTFRVCPCTDEHLIAECARLNHEPLEGFAYLSEARKSDNPGWKKDTRQVESRHKNIDRDDLEKLGKNRLLEKDPSALDGVSKTEQEKLIKTETDALQKDIRDGKVKGYSYDKDSGAYMRDEMSVKVTSRGQQKALDAPKLLRDSDIKKINGMLPYTIEATFDIRRENGTSREVRYIIGVKTTMHLIRTQDLAEDLRELISGDIKSLRKVRYQTGEITFQEYLLNLKALKADAAKHINRNKRWVNTLKRLADYRKMNGSLMKEPIRMITGGAAPIPNGTMILTQTDVTTLTNQTGVDLSKVSNAKKLCRSLFLVAIGIVDASAGSMRVLFPDSSNDWDVQSLAAVDAELAKTDNSQIMRELNKMVNR